VLFHLLNEQQTIRNGKPDSKQALEVWCCTSPFVKLLLGTAEFYGKSSYTVKWVCVSRGSFKRDRY